MENIIIVGASASIGNAILTRFRSVATRIVATYFSNNRLRRDEKVHPLFLDLRSDDSIKSFGEQIRVLIPFIDTGIFLSSILPGKSLEEYNSNEIDEVFAVNFTGQAKVIKEVLSLFRQGSQIILCSSISAQKGSYDPIYAASKGAILSFVKALASGLSPGIRVNAIAPGLIKDSTMYQSMDLERREFHRLKTPNKQFLTMTDLAGIIFDLSGDHWVHVNGACIDINGGEYVR